jgi:imidazolonepropionase-like amidohydrolase
VRLDEEVGTVQPGKLADLVIVDGDPLEDIGLLVSRVVGVVQGGRVVRDDLGLLEEGRRAGATRNGTRTAVVVS